MLDHWSAVRALLIAQSGTLIVIYYHDDQVLTSFLLILRAVLSHAIVDNEYGGFVPLSELPERIAANGVAWVTGRDGAG
jgi:hypothetical protein